MPNPEQQSHQLSLALKGAKCGLWDWNLPEDKIYFDPNYFLIAGYEPNEFPHQFKEWEKRVHPDDIASAQKAIQQYMAGEFEHYAVEFRFKTKIGGWLWILGKGEVTERDEDGNPVRFVGLHIDISQRKRVEQALRAQINEYATSQKKLKESEERFKALHAASFGGVIIHDQGLILDCNRALSEMTGFSNEELIGMDGLKLIAPNWLDLVAKNIKGGYEQSYEVEGVRKDGSVYPLAIRGKNISYKEREVRVIEFRDITERKQADESLRLSHEVFHKLTSSAKDGIIQIDSEGKVVFWNQGAAGIFGYDADEAMGANLHQLLAPKSSQKKHQEHFPEFLKSGKGNAVGKTIELEAIRKDGQGVTIELSLSAFQLNGEMQAMAVVRDISERKQAEAKQQELETQLRQKHKMEAVGVMAGGIAHDFNNILAIILTNLELMRRKMDDDNPLLSRLEQAQSASLRASDLIKQILTYSRQGKQDLKPVDLAFVVEESLKLLRSTIPATVEILTQIDEGAKDTMISADSIQIEEVLINLCNNAVYAMEEKGLLTVSLSKEPLATDGLPVAHELPENDYIKLTVEDTGSGMSPEVLEKIFDPFYTTKPIGSGTGMGLSISHGIIEKHNGCLIVDSTPRQGSVFSIYWPVLESIPDAANELIAEDLPTGNERILLIDDEESLAHSVSDFLMAHGYSVTTQINSRKALDLFKDNAEQFDLVITDQTMPNLTGVELATQLLNIKPELPIILCTGYSSKITEEKAKEVGIKAFFMKPLSLQGLVRITRKVLDEEES